MLHKFGKKAQTTAEYAILIAVIVGAVVAMQVYVRRGMQGRIRDVVDHVGDAADSGATALFTTGQYEPYYMASEAASTSQRQQQEVLGTGGVVGRASADVTGQARQQVMGWGVGDGAERQEANIPAVARPARPVLPGVPREE